VSGCSSEAIGAMAGEHPAPGSQMLSDGLALPCGDNGRLPPQDPCHQWEAPQRAAAGRRINTRLGNLKTSFSSTFHACNFDKVARHTSPAPTSALTGVFDGCDDRTDRQCALLLCAVQRTGSQGLRGLWVIKSFDAPKAIRVKKWALIKQGPK